MRRVTTSQEFREEILGGANSEHLRAEVEASPVAAPGTETGSGSTSPQQSRSGVEGGREAKPEEQELLDRSVDVPKYALADFDDESWSLVDACWMERYKESLERRAVRLLWNSSGVDGD